MIGNKQATFVLDFLDALIYLDTKTIPFKTQSYNKRVDHMKEVFKQQSPDQYEEMSTLFLKTPIYGDYHVLAETIQQIMGRKAAIEAPYFNRLKLANKTPSSPKPNKTLETIAKAFCQEI